ncbi:MAG TPA: prepilin-type N-terminal cleavage/methylation domain-containing protein [Lacunisphaera sp.]|nr:prepilin-type N-terminal cleavage/methylation domain-containing protein [Lacunisphaera sp.]
MFRAPMRLRPARAPALSKRSASNGFTLVEVMMAALILVVGFIGMIEAVTLASGMMDHARRQTLANQILNHEIEALRLQSWTNIAALPTSSTSLGATYASGTTYYVGDTCTYNGAWYRCIQQGAGQTPAAGSAYWVVDTPPYSNAFTTSTSGIALGATYTLTRTVANLTTDGAGNTNMREITFTVQWVVATSRRDSSNNPLTFTYRRVNTAYFGKYGLNLTYQRS